jgi:hypothetical protein
LLHRECGLPIRQAATSRPTVPCSTSARACAICSIGIPRRWRRVLAFLHIARVDAGVLNVGANFPCLRCGPGSSRDVLCRSSPQIDMCHHRSTGAGLLPRWHLSQSCGLFVMRPRPLAFEGTQLVAQCDFPTEKIEKKNPEIPGPDGRGGGSRRFAPPKSPALQAETNRRPRPRAGPSVCRGGGI